VEVPEGASLPSSLELNLSYQMNFQKAPVPLLINEPLKTGAFEITFTNLRDLEAEARKRKKPLETQPSPETLPSPEVLPFGETQPESQPAEVTRLRFFAPVMFLYPREIRFQVYLRDRVKNWTSPLQTLSFFHERKETESGAQCESEIVLQPIRLGAP
jgi:hypothetical protein